MDAYHLKVELGRCQQPLFIGFGCAVLGVVCAIVSTVYYQKAENLRKRL